MTMTIRKLRTNYIHVYDTHNEFNITVCEIKIMAAMSNGAEDDVVREVAPVMEATVGAAVVWSTVSVGQI